MLVTHAQPFGLLGSGLSFSTLSGLAWEIPRIHPVLTSRLEEMMDIAYAAGLFDGEGMVRIARYKIPNSINTRYQVITMIGMTHEPVIRALCETFGGSVHCNDHSKRNAKHRPQWCWYLSSRKASEFLAAIRPFLIVKAAEVDIATALQFNIDEYKFRLGNRFTLHERRDEIFAWRESAYHRLMELKRPHLPLLKSDPSDSMQRNAD